MKPDAIKALLRKRLEPKLVDDLLDEFSIMQQDVVSGTLGRAAPGKYIETVVQLLQWLETGSFDQQPNVDEYLRNLESRKTSLPDSLRLLVSRVARGVYAIRSKRGIAHKGEVQPNTMDLRCVFASCQWILAELVRLYHEEEPEAAQRIVDALTLPPVPVIEDFGEFRTVLDRSISTSDELLILLEYYYPDYVSMEQIRKDMKRRPPKTVGGAIGSLYKKAWLEGTRAAGYKVTVAGRQQATAILRDMLRR